MSTGQYPQPEAAYSQVVPVMVAGLICDTLAVDPSSGKKTLVGIFDRLIAAQFPTKRVFSIYAKFADAIGRYVIRIEYVQEATDKVLAAAGLEVRATDKTETLEIAITPPDSLLVPDPGRYEFRIFANSIYMGRVFFDVLARAYLQGAP